MGRGQIVAVLSLSALDASGIARGVPGDLDALALEAIELRLDGVRREASVGRPPLDGDSRTDVQLTFERAGGTRLTVRSGVPRRLARGHRELLRIRGADGQLLAERMLDQEADELAIDLGLPAGRPTTAEQFFALGVRHILGGYDHLLFLGALLLGVRRLADVAKTVTAFTAAHSLTLAAAVLGFVRAPAAIVEPMIAASIVYVGLANLLQQHVDSRWKLTFGFGLIHGFGFAGALQELGVGAGATGVATPLGSFNAGVEAGQIAIAMLIWPLIQCLNARPLLRVRVAALCSALVAAAGAYWLAERTLG